MNKKFILLGLLGIASLGLLSVLFWKWNQQHSQKIPAQTPATPSIPAAVEPSTITPQNQPTAIAEPTAAPSAALPEETISQTEEISSSNKKKKKSSKKTTSVQNNISVVKPQLPKPVLKKRTHSNSLALPSDEIKGDIGKQKSLCKNVYFKRDPGPSCENMRNLIKLNVGNISWGNVCIKHNQEVMKFQIQNKKLGHILLPSGISCSATIHIRYCLNGSVCPQKCFSASTEDFFQAIGADTEFTADSKDSINENEKRLNQEVSKMKTLMKALDEQEPIYENWKKIKEIDGCKAP